MYKLNNIFVLAIILILLNSCNETSLTSENSKNITLLSGCYYCDSVANPQNIYDHYGCEHNEAMQQIDPYLDQLVVYDGDSLNQISTLSNLIGWGNNYYGTNIELINQSINNVELIDIINHPINSLNSMLDSCPYSNIFKQYMQSLSNYVTDTTIVDCFVKVDLIKTLENSIINNNTLNSTEKECLLICSSVARYSLVHWFTWTVENNITDIPSKIYKNKNPILMKPAKPKTKVANKGGYHTTPGQKAAGKIAAADFVGAYCGFLNSMFGGPAAMAGGAAVGALGFSAAAAISEI